MFARQPVEVQDMKPKTRIVVNRYPLLDGPHGSRISLAYAIARRGAIVDNDDHLYATRGTLTSPKTIQRGVQFGFVKARDDNDQTQVRHRCRLYARLIELMFSQVFISVHASFSDAEEDTGWRQAVNVSGIAECIS